MRVQRVQKSKKPLNLIGAYSVKALKILKSLGAGNKPSDAAKAADCAKSNVTYWIKRFTDLGAIRLQSHDVFDTYALTLYGSKILARSERTVPSEVVALEDYAQKFEIIEHEKVPIDWRKLGKPRNWVQLGVTVGTVFVEKTSRSIIIHPGKLKGFDVDELLAQSGAAVQRVKDVLENKFGMVLGESTPNHQPVFRFYSEEAKELVRMFGTTNVEGVGSIDNSPPEREPHEEFRGREPAKQRLLMPMRVLRIETEQQKIGADLATLVKQQGEFIKEQREFAKQQREEQQEFIRKQNEFLVALKDIMSQTQANDESLALRKPSRDQSWMVV